ncbi:MAG: preprotein translocase subunit SecE [Dethiobacteria bacterium]|jgi:preprotein translocase subunit SecE
MSYVKKVQRFFHEVRIELKKVNWPSRRELLLFTGIVIIVILIIGVFFWILDSGLTAILRLIIG